MNGGTVRSPCTNVCRMDPETRLCDGCFRTLDEIAGWAAAPDGRRIEILAAVAVRRGGPKTTDPGGNHER